MTLEEIEEVLATVRLSPHFHAFKLCRFEASTSSTGNIFYIAAIVGVQHWQSGVWTELSFSIVEHAANLHSREKVIATAFWLLRLVVLHELEEAFEVDAERPMDPHHVAFPPPGNLTAEINKDTRRRILLEVLPYDLSSVHAELEQMRRTTAQP